MAKLNQLTAGQKVELREAALDAGLTSADQLAALDTGSISQGVMALALAANQRISAASAALAWSNPLGIFAVSGYANLTKPYSLVPFVKGGAGARSFTMTGTLPAGLTFSAVTGEISGTPTATGTYGGIIITVSDGSGTAICLVPPIVVGAAPTVITPSGVTTGGTDAAAINTALAAGNSVQLDGLYYTNAPIFQKSNTAIYGATNTEIRLAAGSNCRMWANANQATETRTDSNLGVYGDGTFYWNGQPPLQVRSGNQRLFHCFNAISTNNLVLSGLRMGAAGSATSFFGCLSTGYRNITWEQDGTQVNQDGLDIGAGCTFAGIDHIRGRAFDDAFSFFNKRAQSAAAMMSGIPWEYGANGGEYYISDVQVDCRLDNMFRLQAGTGFKMDGVYAKGIHNTYLPDLATTNKKLFQFGAGEYIPIPPSVGDYANIRFDDVSGFGTWAELDTSGGDVKIRNINQNCKLQFGIRSANVDSTNAGVVKALRSISVEGVVGSYTAGSHGVLIGNFIAGTNPSSIRVSKVFLNALGRILSTDDGIDGLELSDITITTTTANQPIRSATPSRGTVKNVTVAGVPIDLNTTGLVNIGATVAGLPTVTTSAAGTTIENVPYTVEVAANRAMLWTAPSGPFTLSGSSEDGWKLTLAPQLYASVKSSSVTLRGTDFFGNQISWTHTVTITADPTLLPGEDTAYSVYKASRVAPLTTSRAQAYSDLLSGLRSDGVLPLLDRLFILADEASVADAAINLVAPSATKPILSGTFTASRGIAGNGTNQTPVNLGSAAPYYPWDKLGKFSLNSGSYFVYCNQQNGPAGTSPHIGVTANPQNRIFATDSGGAESYSVNTAAAAASTRTSTSRLGHRGASRTAPNLTTYYYNGVPAGTSVNVATGVSYGTACVGRDVTTYSADRFAFEVTGAGLTDAQAAAVHARLFAFLNSFGAA